MPRATVRNPLDAVVARAVELSRVPGTSARESGAGRGVATNTDITTLADENGFTRHIFILDLDALDDPQSFLG